MKYLIYALLIGFLAGCSDGLVDFESGEVEGRVSDGKLTIFNKLDDPVYYYLIERETAALVDLVFNFNEMNKIKARHTKRIFLDDIYGYENGDEILMYYWPGNVPGSDNFKRIVIKTD